MNKVEYRKFIESKYNDPGYSYVSKEDKELEMQVHDLLVDIMTNEESANRLIAMFPFNYGLPSHCLAEDEIEEIETFECITIHSDILDDGEFHVIYDQKTDRWFFDRTYDFLECYEEVCENLGVKSENARFNDIGEWRRHEYSGGCSLGLDDLVAILECVKSGDFTGLRDKIPMTTIKEEIALNVK